MIHRLGDICTITKGVTGIMKAVPGTYPMVTLAEERRSHSEFQFDVPDGAVIVPLVSSTGHGHASLKRVHYQEGKFALGNILCAIIPKDPAQLLAKYLHIFLQDNKEGVLVPFMRGMANVSLPMGKIADIELDVPSLDRQREIIDIETHISRSYAQLTQFCDEQERLTNRLQQAILQDAVKGTLTAQWRNQRTPSAETGTDLLAQIRAEKAELIKAKKLKKEKPLLPITDAEKPFDVPEGWVWCRLGEVTESSFYGPRFSNSDYVEDGIPTIRTTDMTPDGRIELRGTPTVYLREKAKLKLYKIEDGDLLVTRSGSIGIMAVFRGNYLALPSAYLIRFRFSKLIISEYIFMVLKSPYWQNLMGLSSTATAQVNINATSMWSFPIPLPPLAEQQAIVAAVERAMGSVHRIRSIPVGRAVRNGRYVAESVAPPGVQWQRGG